MDTKKLTWDQKNRALSVLFFLTDKCNRDIKARKVARGYQQCMFDGYIISDASSPTVLTGSFIITTAKDAHEGRGVSIMDIPGEYLNTETDTPTETNVSPDVLPVDILKMGEEAEQERLQEEQLEEQQNSFLDIFDSLF